MKLHFLAAAALTLTSTLALAEQGNPGAHFVENWDLDGDGKVTLAEATERRGDVFTTFDADEDDVLNGEEYALFDEARETDMKENAAGHGQGMGQGKGQGGMRNAAEGLSMQNNDMDGDSKVTREEFVGRTAWWVETMDRNGDGAITTADFGRH